MTSSTSDRYTGAEYLEANPDWHIEDSPWKATNILRALDGRSPQTICEVGCGAGAILAELQRHLPSTQFVGYDIAPKAIELATPRENGGLSFVMGDAADAHEHFDVMLVIDVIEHVNDPIAFLSRLRSKADVTVLHIPLDMNLLNVARARKLQHLRDTVGHIHYFTPETAVATVEDAGYEVVSSFFTETFKTTQPTLKARIAMYPRMVLPPRLAARALGGYSLMVTAVNRPQSG